MKNLKSIICLILSVILVASSAYLAISFFSITDNTDLYSERIKRLEKLCEDQNAFVDNVYYLCNTYGEMSEHSEEVFNDVKNSDKEILEMSELAPSIINQINNEKAWIDVVRQGNSTTLYAESIDFFKQWKDFILKNYNPLDSTDDSFEEALNESGGALVFIYDNRDLHIEGLNYCKNFTGFVNTGLIDETIKSYKEEIEMIENNKIKPYIAISLALCSIVFLTVGFKKKK